MSIKNQLNIINEDGKIIGQETRENIHKNGLLHREIHVWFYVPKGEIIFQHRAKNKDTYPDFLDATVGGHVEEGEDYETAAIKEVKEETGVSLLKENLHLIKMVRNVSHDKITGNINNVIRAIYTYKYEGKIEDLKIEEGKALGFEAWPLEKIFNISTQDKKKFIPSILNEEVFQIFKKIQNIFK